MDKFLKQQMDFFMMPWMVSLQLAALGWGPLTALMRRAAAFPHHPGPMH